MRLPRYEAMQSSEVASFAYIPNHWGVKRLRSVVTVRNSNVDKLTKRGEVRVRLCNYTDVYKRSIIRSDDRFMEATATEDEIRTFRLRAGDVIITKDSEDWQDIGVPAYVASTADDLVCGYHLTMLRSRPGMMGRFLYWLIRSSESRREFAVAARGVTRYGMTLVGMKNVSVLVPPLDEQAAIVRFLDHAVGRLDWAIAAKRRVVRLLEEQRRAVVHRAVTRGLDPDARMVDSGVPWLGEMPEGWETVPLKRAAKITPGFAFSSSSFVSDGGQFRLLRGINVSTGFTRWNSVVGWNREENDGLGDFVLSEDDLVLGMDRPFVSGGTRAAIIGPRDLPALLLQRVCRIRPSSDLDKNFAFALLTGQTFVDYVEPIFSGVSVPHMSGSQIGGFVIPLPPREEQKNIMARVRGETERLSQMIQPHSTEIALLEEYRTALVSEVVTGRRDVRAAAATLPAPPAPADNLEAFDAGEDDFEDTLTEAALAQ